MPHNAINRTYSALPEHRHHFVFKGRSKLTIKWGLVYYACACGRAHYVRPHR